ncbi:LysR family transcriptional regulator [Klebsiella oxytoca]|jgi:DNA-binding transcriptional LysR family regulator|uniref:LysR family transcriptional regulator n=1 Tax=Klebsiella oxytoca TaxID=571 RepID=UPI0029314CC6|nr:LysR family transcriptional regulator [Klebsiella oxytoca]
MELSQHVRAIVSFIEAADTGSFVSAARSLGMSAAAISKNIAGLEQVIGVRLMNRTTRKISLTEEGTTFLNQVRIAIDALNHASDVVLAKKMGIQGHVRIATSAAFGRDYLLPALPGLQKRYPGVTIEADFDDRVTDIVKDGYDLAIRGGRIVDSSLISRPVCHLSMILVASPAYLEKYGVPESPEDLKKHRLIARRFLGGRVSSWGFKSSDGSITTLDPESASVTISAPETQVQAALLNLGIAQVGVHHALEYLQAGRLKVVLLGQHEPGRYEMVIQYPHRVLIAPRVKATIEYLLDTFHSDEKLHFPLSELDGFAW